MTSEEAIFIDSDVRIGATVTYPEKDGRRPAVILIAGTGKSDRDGNMRGFHTDLYKNLTASFGCWGYVAIRYDKRGTYASGGDFGTAGLSDLVDDAVSVIRHAKTMDRVDPENIIVCGHSEGTMIAAIASTKEKVAGLILLGGAGMCMRDALYYQNIGVAKEAENMKGVKGFIVRRTNSGDKGINRVDSIFDKCDGTDKDRVLVSGIRMNAKWMREHDSYTSEDFVSMVKDFGGPVLAITGTADLSADYRALEAFEGADSVECYAPENVNHVLREVDDDNSYLNIKKQYPRLCARPMHEGVSERMRLWMESRFP